MKQEAQSLRSLAAELTSLKAEAKALGVFTNERELLTCPQCGLVEDVTSDGLLITSRPSVFGHDTGLRFEEIADHRFRCPACGSMVREESAQGEILNESKPRRNLGRRSKQKR